MASLYSDSAISSPWVARKEARVKRAPGLSGSTSTAFRWARSASRQRFLRAWSMARFSWGWAEPGSRAMAFWNSFSASSSQPRSASSMPRSLC